MAKVNPTSMRDWNNGETIHENEYEQERSILITAINDNFDRLIKKYDVLAADGTIKSTQTLSTAINYLKFKEGNAISLVLDNTTSTLTVGIVPQSVKTGDLQDLAVITSKIADGSITTIKLGTKAITTEKLADGSVTEVKLADGSITRAKIVDGAVSLAQIDTASLDTRYYTESEVDGKVSALQTQITKNGADITDLYARINVINTGVMQGIYQSATLATNPANGTIVLLTADYTANGKNYYKDCIYKYNSTKGEWDIWLDPNTNQMKATIQPGQNVLSSYRLSSVLFGDIQGKTVTNLVPTEGWEVGNINTSGGDWNDGVTTTFRTKDYINVKPSQNYYAKHYGVGVGVVARWYDSNKTFILANGSSIYKENLMPSPANASYVRFVVFEVSDITKLQYTLNEGTTAQEFVANVKGLTNPTVIHYSKNLFNINRVSLHANAKRIDEKTIELNATAIGQNSTIDIKSIPNTTYTLYGLITKVGDLVAIRYVNASGVETSAGNINDSSNTKVFTTLADTEYIRLLFNNQSIGITQWKAIMLVLGDQTQLPTEYEPYQMNMKTYLTTVYDKDKIYHDLDGNAFKDKHIEEVTLNGTENWALNQDKTGYKEFIATLSIPKFIGDNVADLKAVKYNGKILNSTTLTASGIDNIGFSTSNMILYLTIADTDSGWGETYTPTADEIKAYFMGWKMYEYGKYPQTYNGTGVKAWHSIAEYIATGNATSGTQVLPISPYNGYFDKWQPYRLLYELAQPQQVAVKTIGEIQLHEGLNIVELTSGVIRREMVYPTLQAGVYRVADNYYPQGNTKCRVDHFLHVYKNGDEFYSWFTDNSLTSFGKERLLIQENIYNGTDVIEVDYIALPYQLTTSPTPIEVTYNKNIGTQTNENTKAITELQNDVSVIEQTFARKEQPNWIEPVLLNGWVNFGTTYNKIGFYKDEIGNVRMNGLIKSGTIGSIAFYLPKGYRPNKLLMVSTTSANSFGQILVRDTGAVEIQYGVNTWVSFENISFRAEQ